MTTGYEALLPQHLADLRRSGLSDEQIAACGFRSVTDPADWLRALGRRPKKDAGPALGIPFRGADGSVLDYVRFKPDRPRIGGKDRPVKYESPAGVPNRAYFPPATLKALSDPKLHLVITEGEKKAAKADQEGFPCVGLVGVYGWQMKRPRDAAGRGVGQPQLIPDLAAVGWHSRHVSIVFDSDAADKPAVRRAAEQLARTLARSGAIVSVVRLPAGANGSKQGLDDLLVAVGPDGLRRLLDQAKTFDGSDARPSVLVDHDEHRVVPEVVAALAIAEDLYQRGSALVEVIGTNPGGATGRPAIYAVPPSTLRLYISRHSRLEQWRGRGEDAGLRPMHPPEWLVNAVHQLRVWLGVPRLDALVSHPVILPDGSVLNTPGYHAPSRLFAGFSENLRVDVPARPTTAELRTAVDTLLDPVVNFPFETTAHRAAWVAALLTPLARFTFEGPAPLFLIDGNTRGVGKGLLADVIGIVLTGRRFATTAYSNDSNELRKKITSLALRGDRLVLFDNLTGVVGNDALDIALTSAVWSDRLLGGNSIEDWPLDLTFFATGNNVQFRGDTLRRVCPVRLQTADEDPDWRHGFRYPNLREHVRRSRNGLLTAALTILRCWFAAGRPSQNLPTWGSYEEWSIVRDVVVFAGLPDPGDTRRELKAAADRDAVAMTAILRCFRHLDPQGRGLTVKALLNSLTAPSALPSDLQADAQAALDELCERVSSHWLAVKLRGFRGRTFAGMLLTTVGEKNGSARWAVHVVDRNSAGGSGAAGDDSVRPASATAIP